MSTTLSTYQQAILDWVATGSGNATVKATAGSGKTFILGHVSRMLPDGTTGVYLAFGRANADEAQDKFAIPASTFHSLCFKAVGRFLFTRVRKYVKTVKPNTDIILDEMFGKRSAIDDIRAAVVNLVSKVKGENLPPTVDNDTLQELIERFDIDWDDPDFTVNDVCDITRRVLAEAMSLDGIARRGTIDFDDQLWLVERFNVRLDTFDFVLVDEAQDTNVIQRAIIRRVSNARTRVVAVGDDCQAIYGFRGATSDALDLIASEFSATVLPLSISYRCPRLVCELAAKYGTIEAAPNAKDGAILHPTKYTVQDVGQLQLVLCRNTAPLITLAYKMIAARVPVIIRGRDIGAGLKSLITKLSGKRGTLETLPDRLEAWRAREADRAIQARNETKAQSINDRAESINALIDSMSDDEMRGGIPSLLGAIDELFGMRDKADAGINGKTCLSTVHKAKGLEADRVGILDWELMPSKFAKRADQQRQERNLQFVAITRSKDTLTFFTSDHFKTAQ